MMMMNGNFNRFKMGPYHRISIELELLFHILMMTIVIVVTIDVAINVWSVGCVVVV